MRDLKLIIASARPPFLILAVACVFLGVSLAVGNVGAVNGWEVALALIAGVMAHISVNAFNEYQDFKTKLDERTQRTPFSGGSGLLQAKPHLAPAVLGMALITAILTALIGLFFVIVRGPILIPIGLLGLMVIVAYTPLFVYFPVFSLVAPGLGFGIVMVNGVEYALSGMFSWAGLTVSLVPFFLVNNLLLLNQFPDAEADQSIGKRHYPILLGKRTSSLIYIVFQALAYVAIVVGVLAGVLPAWTLLGLLTLPLAARAAYGAYRYAEAPIPELVPYLVLNVLVNILTPLLLGVGILVAG